MEIISREKICTNRITQRADFVRKGYNHGKKKNTASSVHKNNQKAYIEHAGEVVDQKITDTLEKTICPTR